MDDEAHPSMTELDILSARRRRTVATEVRDHIRRRIIDGRLPPDHPLSENEMAAQLGVSRTPVREAFIRLEEEGLIAVYPQYGSFVAPIRVEEVRDSQFVRESIECAGLSRVIERLGVQDEADLRANLALQERMLGSDGAFFEADEGLHAMLLRIAGHPRAWLVVEGAKAQHDRVRRLAVQDPGKRRATFLEHRMIVERVIARDLDGALAAMRQHLRAVFATVQRVMSDQPEFFSSALTLPPRPARPDRRQTPPPTPSAPATPG